MDVREEQDIGISLDFAVCSPFMAGGFFIDSQVKGKRSVYDTAGDFPFLIHFGQFCRINGNRHFGIHNLNGGKGSYLGIGNAAGMSHFNGIFNDMYLILQSRIGHECNVGKEKKLFNSGNIKYTDM